MMDKFFNPQKIAVIGASADKNKVGFALMKNILSGPPTSQELRGASRTVYPVSLTTQEILGLKAYTSVLDIPDEIDLVIIAVRADTVPQVLKDCGQKHIPNAIVVSSGFKETGAEGKYLEEQIAQIATEQNITLLGPNCLGVIDANNNFNASFSAEKPLPGHVALLSQSGALGTAMLDWALGEGVGFSKFISLGNEAQIDEIDFLKYLEEDPNTSAILMYLEKVNLGQDFIQVLKSITAKKQVVILKAGVSEYGASAIKSHTGSLAPESKVFSSACKQAGAILVPSLRKFFNIAKLLSIVGNDKTPVQRLAVLTNGGGPSVITADEIGTSNSLSLTTLDENAKDSLRKVLPKMAAVGNPVDIIGDALAERYDKALNVLCEIPAVDGIIVMLTPQMMTEAEATAQVLAKYKDKKRIFPVFIGGPSIQSGRQALIRSGLIHFTFSKDLISGLEALANGAPKSLQGHPFGAGAVQGVPLVAKAVFDSVSQISFADTIKILNDYGIRVEGNFINKKEDLESTLNALSDGPYAMKAISGAAVHKTEAGTVRLNISDFDEAGRVWEELWTNPTITGQVEGILIQKMIGVPASTKSSQLRQGYDGQAGVAKEVIIGMKRDATFGPTILFGLGGILAEAIKDTTLRVAPLEKSEALKMMQEIKGIKILQGMRGQSPVNFDALADIIVALSRLALAHPEIKEIDLNPVMATSEGATLVDVRMMV